MTTRTPDAVAERRTQDRERLELAIASLKTSNGWRAWLRCRSAFHAYSFNNSMLIASALPTATRVAGFGTWQRFGRQVRRGERSIRIYAPRAYVEPDENGEDIRRVYFRTVPVFDISQTDGKPLPEPPRESLTGASHAGHLPKLEQLAQEIGFSVHHIPLDTDTGGYCSQLDQKIVVNATLHHANAQVRVLVHEIAHALGIGYAEHGRDRAEVLVECVTYIVCGSIGLDTTGESVPYIAGWDDSELDDLRAFAEIIDVVARRIEQALE